MTGVNLPAHSRGKRVTFFLTLVTVYVTHKYLACVRAPSGRHAVRRERDAVPAGGIANPHSGGFRVPGRPALGPVCTERA